MIKIKYNYYNFIVTSKNLTQTLDVALTAVTATHTDEEYGVFLVLSLGLPRSYREKEEDYYICLHVYIMVMRKVQSVWL